MWGAARRPAGTLRCWAVTAVAAVLAAGVAAGPSGGSGHGYRSSRPWLPRKAVVTSPTGEELVGQSKLPKAFDWRNVSGRSYAAADINQHIPVYCGSCWIHGTTDALNDRIKIMRGAKWPDIMLSRQAMMNCVPDPSSQGPPPGCNGGDAWMVHKYMQEHKIPDETCNPYAAENQQCEPINICRNCFPHTDPVTGKMEGGVCFAVEGWTGYGVKEYGNISGEAAMMKEIYARGPIACSFATDETFMKDYSTNKGVVEENVYIDDKQYTDKDVDHVMEVAGWGETESGLKYWVVRNSWGTYWGDMGWLKLRRGVNQQMSESDCDWGVPDIHDVQEDVAGKVMGDYMTGIVSVQPAGAQASLSAVAAAPSGTTATTASLLAAAGGVAVGALAMRLLGGSRAEPRQPDLLG